MTGQEGIENRRSPRRDAGWRAIIKAPDKRFYQARVNNVGAQGLLLEMDRQFPPNTLLMIKVEVLYRGDRDELVVSAKVRHNVVRTTTFLIGVQIVKMDKKTEDFLYDYSHENV